MFILTNNYYGDMLFTASVQHTLSDDGLVKNKTQQPDELSDSKIIMRHFTVTKYGRSSYHDISAWSI